MVFANMMNGAIVANDDTIFVSKDMTSKPRGTYLDPLKACALSGVSSVQAGKSESSTFTKYMGIVRQTRRNASRTSVLNDVERTRYTAIMRRIESENDYSKSVLERQARMFRNSLAKIEKHKRSLYKQVEGTNSGPSKTRVESVNIKEQAKKHNDSLSKLLMRQKDSSSRTRCVAKNQRALNNKLPSIFNKSISGSEDKDVRSRATERPPPSDISNPSRTARGGLALPVFVTTTTAIATSFYTENKLYKENGYLNGSDEQTENKSEKLKLPAITRCDTEHC